MCKITKQKRISIDPLSEDNEKILIIDDDSLIRKSMKRMVSHCLRKFNLDYEIIEGEDGSDMINLVNDDTENLIRLIFTDENMNDVEGSEAITSIKRIKDLNSIKIISITSLEDEESVSRILGCGADRVCKKPASVPLLEDIFRCCILA
jgi:response regulator RpfG family c-di-GMP phosphodiesterase